MMTANVQAHALHDSYTSCLKEIEDVLVEVKQRVEERRRMDELLRTIGVSHGLTLEETAQLQNEHPREREEYQALQDANLLTCSG